MTSAKKIRSGTKSIITILVFLLISVLMSREISTYMLDGLKLAWGVIIPTVFPFMIFSEAAYATLSFCENGMVGKIYEKIFAMPRATLAAFVCGILGGFPVGAKMSIEMKNNGIISKEECERLMTFSNIPSIAYTVCAVGIGFWNDVYIGILLYLITLISAVICGKLIGIKKSFSCNTVFISKQSFNFIGVLKSAAASSVNIAFFIAFFAVICGIIRKYIVFPQAALLLISFFEVGNAVSVISDLRIFSPCLSLAIIAFSLSFSGISVIMQSLSMHGGEDISFIRFFKLKLLQGGIAFVLSGCFFSFYIIK
ncbi:MAG: hypothetical protein J6Q68_05510 [Clostridia bacterium]|nr:hypothetical protein [Clostridia bacterium]